MRQCKRRTVVTGLILSILFLIGCETIVNTRYVSAPLAYRDQYLEVTARFLGEEDLQNRYGIKNPFVAPPRAITKFEFQVFELYLDFKEEITTPIALRDITLTFGGEAQSPKSISAMISFWEREIAIYEDEGRVTPRYSSIIRDALLPHRIAGSSLGLVIFRGNFPLEGLGRLTIPHPVHSQKRSSKTQKQNTSEATGDSPTIELAFEYSYSQERKPFNPFGFLESQ